MEMAVTMAKDLLTGAPAKRSAASAAMLKNSSGHALALVHSRRTREAVERNLLRLHPVAGVLCDVFMSKTSTTVLIRVRLNVQMRQTSSKPCTDAHH